MVMFHVLGLSLIKISSFVLQVNRLVVESRSEMRRVKEEAAYWCTVMGPLITIKAMYYVPFETNIKRGIGSNECSRYHIDLKIHRTFRCWLVLQ